MGYRTRRIIKLQEVTWVTDGGGAERRGARGGGGGVGGAPPVSLTRRERGLLQQKRPTCTGVLIQWFERFRRTKKSTVSKTIGRLRVVLQQ